MEKYVVPIVPPKSPKNPSPIPRSRWKRILPELNGRISSKHRHQDSQLLLDSCSEVRGFEHHYRIGSDYCPTYTARMSNVVNYERPDYFLREGITGLEFDSKGVYLASVTKSGCLTVHDFETLYCLTYGPSSSSMEDETKHLLHISTSHTLDAVRWNPTNQDEAHLRNISLFLHWIFGWFLCQTLQDTWTLATCVSCPYMTELCCNLTIA